MERAEFQAVQLVLAFGLGLSLGLFYDFYRLWLLGGKKKIRAVGDLCWCILAMIWTFGGLYFINGGEIRFMVCAFGFLGMTLYLGFLSPVILPILKALLGVILKILAFLWRLFETVLHIFLLPVVWIFELIMKVLGCVFAFIMGIFAYVVGLFGKLAKFIQKTAKNYLKKVDFDEEVDI